MIRAERSNRMCRMSRRGTQQSLPTGLRSATRRRFSVDIWAEWLGFRLVSPLPEPGDGLEAEDGPIRRAVAGRV